MCHTTRDSKRILTLILKIDMNDGKPYCDSPYFNPDYKKDWLLYPPYIPMPSKHWYVRWLDAICYRYPDNKEFYTPFAVFHTVLWGLSVFEFIFFHYEFCGHFLFTWYLCICAPQYFLRIDLIYRFFRNRYLEKHKLPGPYGYGSIDPDSWIHYN